MTAALAERIDALLPQTQCQRCGYPACRPYADAIVRGEAQINQCPPGGDAGIEALAALLGRPTQAMNPANGAPITQSTVAFIEEAPCIGCTKCIQVCPTDAIVGAANLMHTVIVDECSGCELCIPACPVDCIVMQPAAQSHLDRASQYRMRYEARLRRLDRRRDERESERQRRRAALTTPTADSGGDPVARALAAARARRGPSS
ncbi:RnfABCDGE type electron transport complex subunit B [Solimonas marina]|uniref:RnfABCDGE type electron transport complex subunit B n=1 Tax=Solimonas marina TaxID=2714601 RepID=A0A969WCE6_9GAMM|nr:RnfABCDGE type electron transport complex subunit B [Solimonas marina]